MTARRGCLIAFVGALGLASALAALVGPSVLREGRRFYQPIAKLKHAEVEMDALRKQHPWKTPAQPELTADQLARFLEARRQIGEILADASFDPEALRRGPRDLRDVGDALEGVGDVVSRQLDVFVKVRMTPAEYHYVARLIYRQWRPALQHAGTYPATLALAAGEVDAAAAREARSDVARRLREVAAGMRGRTPPAPPGIPEAVHALLLARVDDIERWSLDERRSLRTAAAAR